MKKTNVILAILFIVLALPISAQEEIEDQVSNVIGSFLGFVGPAVDWVYLLSFVIVAGSIVFALITWIRIQRAYKHTMVVRIVTDNRKRIMFDKFREFVDSDGVTWWRLRKRKHTIPVSPPDAIELMGTGSIFVEAYYTPEGEYVFFSDEMEKEHVKEVDSIVYTVDKKNLDKRAYNDLYHNYLKARQAWEINPWYAKIRSLFFRKWYVEPPEPPPPMQGHYAYISDNKKSIDAFQPLTTKQRLILVAQYKKAQERKKFSFWQNLPQLAAISGVIILVLMAMVFWEDITKPSLEAQEKMKQIAGTQLEITKLLHDIILEKQSIGQDEGTRALVGDEPPP